MEPQREYNYTCKNLQCDNYNIEMKRRRQLKSKQLKCSRCRMGLLIA
jgi:hypothetical protein